MSSSVIPATTPVSWTAVPDGSAASPSFAFQNSSGTGFYRVSANVLGISTAGVQRVVVDASGNVGVGTGSPGRKLDIVGADNTPSARLTLSANTNGAWQGIEFVHGAYIKTGIRSYSTGVTDAGALTFLTAPAGDVPNERMRIDSSGRVLVNNSLTHNAVPGVVSATAFGCRAGVGGAASNAFNINWTGSAQLWIDTTNQGTFTLSSDYRIKKNIETQTLPALERVVKLRPVTYELADYGELFKADGIVREGFIAHEVQEVIPSGAEGKKDEENRIQNLRVDAILAVAVKAIQELSAKVEEQSLRLEAQAAEIEALKAK